MSTVADELADAEKEMARWVAEIAEGNISVFTLNKLSEARGARLALGILLLSWDCEHDRRSCAKRNIVEAQDKLNDPGSASIMAKAGIAVYARYLSGDLTIG